jgi:hypothetical protein
MEWISVKDRLPCDEQEVLVYDSKRGIHKTFFVYEPYECEEGGFDKHGFAIMDVSFENITHWQPLPEPPKD